MGYAKGYAAQLVRGEQINNVGHHHFGMRELLAQQGRPRPEGTNGKRPLYTLSLVNPDSSTCYRNQDGYLLSTNPEDYEWETYLQNRQRISSEVRRSAAKSGGRAAGRIRMDSLGPEGRKSLNRLANHTRHHIKKNVVNPNCNLCIEESGGESV